MKYFCPFWYEGKASTLIEINNFESSCYINFSTEKSYITSAKEKGKGLLEREWVSIFGYSLMKMYIFILRVKIRKNICESSFSGFI